MSVELQELVRFHRTGKAVSDTAAATAALPLKPALFAHYGDLSALRYDYPLILLDLPLDGEYVLSLTDYCNHILRKIAPQGAGGNRVRLQMMALETAMRRMSAQVSVNKLSRIWNLAGAELLATTEEDKRQLFKETWDAAYAAMPIDGLLVNCNRELPLVFTEHAWRAAEQQRAAETMAKIDRLILRLGDMLKVDESKDARSRSARNLKESVGVHYRDTFDFELLAEMLNKSGEQARLPAARKKRIKAALGTLQAQRFFAHTPGGRADNRHDFEFRSVGAAMQAWYERLPELVALNNALAIAELEVDNRYREDRHDVALGQLGAQALSPADLALYPSYFVSLTEKDLDGSEQALLMDALSSDLPIKVLYEVSDLLGNPSPIDAQLHNGLRGQQFASMATGLNDAFVLQVSGAKLYEHREKFLRGFRYSGPALFSVFVTSGRVGKKLPDYLVSAAAEESRAFPMFCYDPGAGKGMAARFVVSPNPQADSDWPVHELDYQDQDLQRQSVRLAFTLADFAVLDSRYADYFAEVPDEGWTESMLPVPEFLHLDDERALDHVPYVTLVDESNRLHRLVVDDKLIRVARRGLERWHMLQEEGGIKNSLVAAALEKARTEWQHEHEQALSELRQELSSAAPAARVAPGAAERETEAAAARVESQAEPPEEIVEEEATDEAYIETPRCTTCDECTQKNDRMFVYDENKQAYIADLTAGTYRELVEAAENCQVAIIHPGKPWNPDEPGLDDLIRRAEALN
jgi:hypothetical protein